MTSPGTPFDNKEYWESRLREHYSLAGVGYLRLGRRYNEWMYRVRGAVFDRVVARIGTGHAGTAPWHGTKVLDIGSGTGFYVDRWLRLGADVTGLDLTDVAVSELQRYAGTQFDHASVDALLSALPSSTDAPEPALQELLGRQLA